MSEQEDPLEIQYNGEVIPDLSYIKLGTLLASMKEKDDWHEYSINLVNTARNDLVNIHLQTNLPTDLFEHNIPSELSAKESFNAYIRIRASKLLKAQLTGKPHILIKYVEVKHF